MHISATWPAGHVMTSPTVTNRLPDLASGVHRDKGALEEKVNVMTRTVLAEETRRRGKPTDDDAEDEEDDDKGDEEQVASVS